MKSHLYESPQVKARKIRVKKETRDEVKKMISEEFEAYKQRIVNTMTAALMLTVNETWNIGPKRMGSMLDNLTEWLEYFTEYMNDGVGVEMLEKRLAERGLLEIYLSLLPENKEASEMPRPKTDDLHFCKYCNSRMKSGDVCGKCDEN